jgi:hypothetical protein
MDPEEKVMVFYRRASYEQDDTKEEKQAAMARELKQSLQGCPAPLASDLFISALTNDQRFQGISR